MMSKFGFTRSWFCQVIMLKTSLAYLSVYGFHRVSDLVRAKG